MATCVFHYEKATTSHGHTFAVGDQCNQLALEGKDYCKAHAKWLRMKNKDKAGLTQELKEHLEKQHEEQLEALARLGEQLQEVHRHIDERLELLEEKVDQVWLLLGQDNQELD